MNFAMAASGQLSHMFTYSYRLKSIPRNQSIGFGEHMKAMKHP